MKLYSFDATFRRALTNTAAVAAVLASANAYATPTFTGGTGATVATVADTTTVTQTTNKAILNWSSFDTNAAQTVNFVQPGATSIALNRISGAATQYNGALNSNGQVWLINPNGFVFGGTAKVNVGSLLVSTNDITDANFNAPTTDISGRDVYRFDIAGNGAIIVRNGAEITAQYPVTNVVNIRTTPDGTAANFDLENPAVAGTTYDSNGPGVYLAGGDFTNSYISQNNSDPNSVGGFIEPAGTPIAATPGPVTYYGTPLDPTHDDASLITKSSSNLTPGHYSITVDISGSNRASGSGTVKQNVLDFLHAINPNWTVTSTDGLRVEVVDTAGNVLASNEFTVADNAYFSDKTFNFNITSPTAVKFRIAGFEPGLIEGQKTDFFGVQLRNVRVDGAPQQYVTFLAQAIKQEEGSKVQAVGGEVNYATATDFTVKHAYGTTVNEVNVNAPVTAAVLVDGVPGTGIDIQNGAFLYAAINVDGSDAPNGRVTLQSYARQDVFNNTRDRNDNGTNDDIITFGPAGQSYTGNELVSIDDGADIRPAPVGDREGGSKDNGGLVISALLAPAPEVPPVEPPTTPPTTPPAPAASLPNVDQNLQVLGQVPDVQFANISSRDVVNVNSFANREGTNAPLPALTGGDLSLLSGGGNANALANLAPAAGGNASDLNNLTPAAGGNAAQAPGSASGVSCANQGLDRIGVFQNREQCGETNNNI